MPDALIAIARRANDEFWNAGNDAAADELYAAEYTHHDPINSMQGPDGMRLLRRKYHSAFPDLTFTIDEAFAHGDRVVTRWTARGTHTGELWHAFPPTGNAIEVTGITIQRISDGLIREAWVNWDTLGMLQQSGVIPAWGRSL